MRRDSLALFLVTIGAWLLPVIGWGIGVWLMWESHRWTTFDKYVGTLLWPFVFIGPGIAFVASRGDDFDSDSGVAPLVVIVGLYFAGIIWITVRLYRHRGVVA